MTLFEGTLALLIVAAVLLQATRRLGAPYPSMLALAGVGVGALPWAPHLAIEPRLALALFVTPALFDAAYDTAPRQLLRHWRPLLSLVVGAVLVTTAAVAWAGWQLAGLPLAAAITLGAIVAPPDAAAASAVLSQFQLSRRTLTILQGESLLNDAVALLLFGVAVAAASSGTIGLPAVPLLLLAVPGGALAGFLLGKGYLLLSPRFAGTLSSTIVELVVTFGAWLVAERLHISPILTVVVFAMTVAREAPHRQSSRDRVHSYSVWEAVVFILNVLAFLLMGLQARMIVSRLERADLWRDLAFAGTVLALVILVRLVWVMSHYAVVRRIRPAGEPRPSGRTSFLVAWCGMRGMLTLATAFALPGNFPGRDVIVLSAFAVVLGTLVLQGLTLGPLMRLLRIEPDESLGAEIAFARAAMLDAAVAVLDGKTGPAADAVRAEYAADRALAEAGAEAAFTDHDRLRVTAIAAQREVLEGLRRDGRIDDDAFHSLERELDWAELDAAAPGQMEMSEA